MKKSFRDTICHCKKTIFSSILVELFQNAVTITAASVIGGFANAIFNHDTAYASDRLMLLLCCITANVLLVPAVSFWGDTISIRESIQYDIHMFSRFLGIQYESAAAIPLGEVKSRLESDVIMYRNSIILVLTRIIIMPLSLTALLILMGRISLLYMLISCLLSFLVLLVPVLTKKAAAKYDDSTRQYQAKAASCSHELILLAPYVKLYHLGRKLLTDYNSLFTRYHRDTQKKSILLKVAAENISTLTGVLATVGVLITGAVLNTTGVVLAGDIAAMAGYYAALLTVMDGVGFVIARTALLKKLSSRIDLFYENEDPAYGAHTESLLPLILRDISFQAEGHRLLRETSFAVHPGQKIAITGKNGTGKSTLLNIITGLYRTYDGEIRCGDHDMHSVPIHVLADCYSYISQQPFVFEGTVRENIRFGNQACNKRETDRIMQELGIFNLRDHTINSKGTNLSGGEMQRIALARAILRNKPLIIMDEPGNHLDTACVEWINDFIRSSDKTLLYVTHDAKLAAIADLRIELL